MSRRRENGLCFNYNEKFSPGHKCGSKLFVFIMEENKSLGLNLTVEPCEPDLPLDPKPNPTQYQAQINLYTLLRHLAPETLRLVGQLSTHNVVIWIDMGSTHNFIQERLIKSLGLKAQHTYSLRVMVGNGNEIEYH